MRAKLFGRRTRKNGKVPDLSLLPPCASSLMLHTASAHYVAKMWRLANIPLQNIGPYVGNGWLRDGSIDWIRRAYPDNVESILMENGSTNFMDESDWELSDDEYTEQDDDNDEIDNDDDESDEQYEI